ncbi:hypothetical protein AK830_g3708 [Neonectria ditissima]|uniref:Uncharacterized protein n=1 Tax=Neonectria ditissima TaxID=78410 RepID=A0A0N8H7W3_9HYPO|nr:hypothetical protein AK830_g3708 [Neonectria ditissima]
MNVALYSADDVITQFFTAHAPITKQQCDEYAASLTGEAGWHYYPNCDLLKDLFWRTFELATGELSAEEKELIQMASMTGLFLQYGFAWENGGREPVDLKTPLSGRLRLILFPPSTIEETEKLRKLLREEQRLREEHQHRPEAPKGRVLEEQHQRDNTSNVDFVMTRDMIPP